MDGPFPENMLADIEKVLALDAEENQHSLDMAGCTNQDIANYRHVFESQCFFPLQRRRELHRMIQIAWTGRQPKTVMEIGADKGGGLFHWCKRSSVERVIACEIRGLPYAEMFERHFPRIKFLWLPRGSRDELTMSELATNKVGAYGIDVLFIDGDKSKFLQDFDAYRPLMNDDGVVFMHDIHDEDRAMRNAWRTCVLRGYPAAEIIDTTESAEAVMRGLNGIPPANPHEAWLRHWAGRSCGVGVIWMREGLS